MSEARTRALAAIADAGAALEVLRLARAIAARNRAHASCKRKGGWTEYIVPHTWVPIGSETVDSYGYRKTKVRDGAQPAVYNWEFNHVLLWEQHHGPVPEGHKIVFRNGDKTKIRIENLECISHAEMMRRNTRHRYPEEINRMIVAKGVLTRAINKRQRQ